MTMNAFRSLLIGSVLSTAAATVASAQSTPRLSPMSEAFLANVRPNVVFLDRSSRLAADHTGDVALRSYARAESLDAVRTVELLKGVAPAKQTAVASNDSAVLMTGRSVAIDGPTAGPGQSANGRQPLGEADVASLTKLSGRKFNDAFWVAQVDALSQLRADYQAYIDDGDDAALIAMAKRELRSVEDRLAALSKV